MMKHQVKLCKCNQCKHHKRFRNDLRDIWIKKFRQYNKKLCEGKEPKYPKVIRYTD